MWCLTKTGARSCFWDNAPKEPGTGRDLCGLELPRWRRPGDLVGPQLNRSQQWSWDANCILGCIYGSFISRDRDVIIPHYSVLVRSHMEHCVQVWILQYGKGRKKKRKKKDVDKLERAIQMRPWNLFKRLEKKPYGDRLKEVGLYTHDKRWLRGLSTVFSAGRVATKRTEAVSSQWATQRRQGALDSRCTRRGFTLISEWNFSEWKQSMTGTTSPRMWWNPPLLQVFKMWLDMVLDGPSAVLWFYDSKWNSKKE